MNWKKSIPGFLAFTRKDRIGILLLLTIILLLLFSGSLLPSFRHTGEIFADSTWIAALRKLETAEALQKEFAYKRDNNDAPAIHPYERTVSQYRPDLPRQLFPFDPNTVDAGGWKKLGLRDKTIQTISNYISKGGHFYKAEDLQRVYGISNKDYEALLPYVRIESTRTTKTETGNKPMTRVSSSRYATVDINIADTTAFIALPGIGSKLAARIINFRDKLGGFYSIDQVGETFGLADSVFTKIKQHLQLTTPVKKININTATLDELKVHPYIKYVIANALIAYRNEHGPYQKIEDLRKVAVITEAVFVKLNPYLTIEEMEN